MMAPAGELNPEAKVVKFDPSIISSHVVQVDLVKSMVLKSLNKLFVYQLRANAENIL